MSTLFAAGRFLEGLLILGALGTWLSRLPYFIGIARLGKSLLSFPDRTHPRFTVSAGVFMIACGLYIAWITRSQHGLLPFVGIALALGGLPLALNFMFPTQVGSGGILDSYGRFSAWSDIESYAWSADGGMLELQLRRSTFFQRRSVAIPRYLHKQLDAYLSHRVWAAEDKPLPQS